KAIASGESIELFMPDEAYSGTKTILKELKFPESIKRIEIIVEAVGFEDGTAWSGGRLWRRDSNAPRGWSPVEKPQGSALNRTAKFLTIGFISSKAIQDAIFHKVSWLESLYIQTEPQCGQVGPQYYLQCGDVVGCRVPSYDFNGEIGYSERVEVYPKNERCRMNDEYESFCEPVTQRLVTAIRPCPTPTPTPTPTSCGIDGDPCYGASCCPGYICRDITGLCVPSCTNTLAFNKCDQNGGFWDDSSCTCSVTDTGNTILIDVLCNG